jgi:hypothetical protein
MAIIDFHVEHVAGRQLHDVDRALESWLRADLRGALVSAKTQSFAAVTEPKAIGGRFWRCRKCGAKFPRLVRWYELG